MADDAPSALDWLREQLRRKGDGEAAPGIGGLRVSKGLAVALVLAVLVIILVLTSKNGGTPAKSAANSASPSASSGTSPDAQADRTPNTQTPAAGNGNAAKPGATTKHSPSGTTGYTRQQRALFLREKPDTDSRILDNLAYDTEVTLICHTEGPLIYGMNGRSSRLWDKVRTGEGKVGYIPDEWVATQSLTTELVGAC